MIVVLNPALWAAGDGPANVVFRQGDGTATSYADNEFDIVFSNSVLEHLGTIRRPVAHGARDSACRPCLLGPDARTMVPNR